ncbi:hypothetical protein HpCOL23_00080 [Helicobacter pylori]
MPKTLFIAKTARLAKIAPKNAKIAMLDSTTAIAIATPSIAPLEIPSKKGSTKGF